MSSKSALGFSLSLAVLGGIGLPGLAGAAEPPSPLLDRFAVTLGSYFTTLDTEVEATDVRFGLGDRVNFEKDLGIDDTDTLFRLEGQFLVGRRHQLNVGFYDFDREGQAVVRREITVRDKTFPVNTEVRSFFDTRFTELSYTYWWVAQDNVTFGLNAGVQNVELAAGVNAGRAVTGGAAAEEDLAIDELVPLVGAEVRFRLLEKLHLRALGRLISASGVGDIENVDILDYVVALEYRFFKNVGLGAAYRGFVADVELARRFTTGVIDYQIDGFEAYLRFWR